MQEQNMDVYAYPYQGNLYINLTNRCTNNCEFCVRRGADGVGGHYLWIKKEPTAEEVIAQMGEDLSPYGEIVFCGFGEPTIRLDVLLQVAAYAKEKGLKVRVNTNGQASLIHGEDITPQLEGKVDCLSVSLNMGDAVGYDNACHSQYGLAAFDGILDFSKAAMAHVPEVILSVVDVIGEEEIQKCKTICAARGIPLRVRSFIEPERG
ncbi:TatD family nuclease-associated radical SAM protein [Eubacteriales bacterium OttesenSCG-928-M02]|nr:TatD family nuclease-associated radical SAM protein [Eubacteriales bacterium OttesenSCG-928-M02]